MKPPQLTINFTDTHYGVHGWEEFNQYARLNWVLWESLTKATSYMNETDRLKVMLAMYAEGYAELQKELCKNISLGGVPKFIGP